MSLEQINDGLAQLQLNVFTKYSILIPSLREHMLTYLQGPTLKNYAQCSNYCNSEIQKFNTFALEQVILEEENDGVNVLLFYKPTKPQKETEIVRTYFQKKKFMFSEASNMLKDIEMFMLKWFKYAKKGQTKRLDIKMKQWPTELMNLKQLVEIKDWYVTIYESMYEDFIKYAKNAENRLTNLCLVNSSHSEMTVTPEFFKTPLFQNAQRAVSHLPCKMAKSDFIATQNSFIFFDCSVSFETIRQKVKKVNADAQNVAQTILIKIPYGDTRKFKKGMLFSRKRFSNRIDLAKNKVRIGKVEATFYSIENRLQLLIKP